MRNTHLKLVLEDEQATDNLVELCNRLVNADVPEEVATALKACYFTALRKDSPGASDAHGTSNRVRGLAVGDALRRV